jgi:hypothetical protein
LAPETVMRLATSFAEMGVHPARRPAGKRVEDDQQLHQIVVGRERGGLDDEDVLAAHVLVDLDEDLHVREPPDAGLRQGQIEVGRNGFRQRPVAVAGQDPHVFE